MSDIILYANGKPCSGKTRLLNEIKNKLSNEYLFVETGEHSLSCKKLDYAIVDKAHIKNSHKFKKKPVEIEAFKLSNVFEIGSTPVWFSEAVVNGIAIFNDDGTFTIKTLEGDHLAKIGDYIIQGVKGELYPCKPDIFELTYEKA
ncbi:hypothetical protein KJBENDCP_00052 [Klebsiella phage vB_KmiS-Kmi2C]|nr:hypothetical protein KJBENDCP_00052 [Klebsiella phage vB_KmiS-Kmi2C]